MNWILLCLALIVVFIVITCAVRWGTEYRDGPAKDKAVKEETVMTAAINMLKDNPTAAGKK